MKDLAKHIEVLLLENDCVIVPELGGFVAHYVSAKYDERDGLFLPPMRTIGFNPQLTINDSLLAQSYAKVYNISMTEAAERIEKTVQCIKNQLNNEGRYEIHHVGLLSVNADGKMEFAPNDAGILSPCLYALDSFRMSPVVPNKKEEQNLTEDMGDGKAVAKTITIKLSTLRKAAVAAVALLALILFLNPIDTAKQEVLMSGGIQNMMPKNITTGEPKLVSSKTVAPVSHTQAQQQVVAKSEEPAYCIVLASGTQRKNAEYFKDYMHKNGFKETRLLQDKKDLKVVYGSYKTDSDAYAALKQLRSDKNFKQAWVMKVSN